MAQEETTITTHSHERLRWFASMRRSLAVRLLGRALLFSACVTVIVTTLQLYLQYRHDVSDLDLRLQQINKSDVDSLAERLWALDENQLRLQLAGILRLPDVRAVELREDGSVVDPLVIRMGARSVPSPVAREYPLHFIVEGKDTRIGTLYVVATLAGIHQRLLNTAFTILVSQAAEIFLVSLFIVYMFHELLTRHLSAIASFVGGYRIDDPPPPLKLRRRPPRHEDELQRVVTAFNTLSSDLQSAYRNLQNANDQLIRDVASRRQAEAVLQERESRIHRLINANIIGIIIFALDGPVIEANEAFLAMVGYSRDDLISRRMSYTGMTPAEWQPVTLQAIEELKSSGSCQPYEKEYERKDGSRVPVLVGAALFEGAESQGVAFVLDLTERKRAEQALRAAMLERGRLAALRAELSMAMTREADLRPALQGCAEAMVRYLDAAFARVWTLSADGQELELQASAGMYTRLDGSHSRIRVGELKIGRIAEQRKPHLTNDVQSDPGVSDHDWARRENMVSFAGYPLIAADRVVGVMGMFSQKPLPESILDTLSFVADGIAQVIERQRAEEVRQELEEQWKAAFESNPTMYFIVGKEGQIVSVNAYGAEQLGYAVTELVGEPVLNVFHEPDRRPVQAHANSCFEQPGRTQTWEARKIRKDGKMLWVRETAKAVFLKKRPVLLVICEDITEQKRAEDALSRSEAYLAEAQRLTHTGSWAWDAVNDKVLYWSEEMFRIFGLDPQANIPTAPKCGLPVHPEDRDKVSELVQNALSRKLDYVVEHRIVLPDGAVREIEIVGHPVLDATGEVVECVGTAIDVTERKVADAEREKLRQLQDDLQHINRVTTLGELSASLSHELKQPIAAAISNAEACLLWLAREEPDLLEMREAATEMIRESRRAADIIDRLRSFYKKETQPERELVAIDEVIRDIFGLLRSEAKQYSISIRIDCAAELPKVTADRVQLQQVLMNLMLNGIEAMKETGGELTVTAHLWHDGYLLVSVSDTGVGLPVENAGEIFSAFFTTKPQGSGMGLAISRSIIESHSGRLWATPNAGSGAVFHFTLPT